MTITQIFGWFLYTLVILYAISGLIYIWGAARSRGSASQMSLFLWGFSIGCALLFGLTDIPKLHLLWVLPAGFFLSFTALGRVIGQAVGYATVIAFAGGRKGAK